MRKYDAAQKIYRLHLTQIARNGWARCETAFHIPFAPGLLKNDGTEFALQLVGEENTQDAATSMVLELTEAQQTLNSRTSRMSQCLPCCATSAPVVLEFDYSDAQLAHLLAHDSDAFCRWEVGQRLAMRRLLKLVKAVQNNEVL